MWNMYLYFIILKLFTNFQNIIFLVKIVANASLKIILLFYIYSSTKSILLTGNITRAVLVKLQCLHHPSFIIQCRHYVNVKIQASLWFKRTINHLWNSSVTKREKRWMIPIVPPIMIMTFWKGGCLLMLNQVYKKQ